MVHRYAIPEYQFGNMLDILGLGDIVDLMRKNEEYFAEFAGSDTAKLFTPPRFENKKRSHGYFFF